MKHVKFGLIGYPIAHSLSPALFKAGYGGRFPYELIETADFEEAYSRFMDGYDGINVTAPFKEKAFAKADLVSDECRLIKATNLLVKTPEGVKAFNSDYLGVRKWLEEVIGSRPSGSLSTLIVGCGGAGKAAAVAAASLGTRTILMNRDISKAEAVARSIESMQEVPQPEVHPLSDFREYFRACDIVIYNIPTYIPAIYELTEDDFRGRPERPAKHVLEANYKDPSFGSELILKAKEANPGFSYTEGKVWLLYQALTGYEIFTSEKPDLASMSVVL